MESLVGIASKVRQSTGMGGGADQVMKTGYVATFELAGRVVRMKTTQPLTISDGDRLALVGTMKGRVFKVLAYNNLSTGIEGSDEGGLRILFGVLLFAFGISAVRNLSAASSGALQAVVALGFVGMSLFAALSGARVLAAVRMLRRAKPCSAMGSRVRGNDG